MPAHRSSCFVVVREVFDMVVVDPIVEEYVFDAIVGAYWSINRAEEVAGASSQAMLDAGAEAGRYRFTVKASTWYDE